MTPPWCCPWCGMKVDVGRVFLLKQHAQEECPRRPQIGDATGATCAPADQV